MRQRKSDGNSGSRRWPLVSGIWKFRRKSDRANVVTESRLNVARSMKSSVEERA